MGMILRIASSRIVGQGDIVGRSGYFSLNLSANSVMRGRLDARRTLKSLVADLRFNKKKTGCGATELAIRNSIPTLIAMPYVALVKNKTVCRTDDIEVLGVYEDITEGDITQFARTHSPLKIATTYDSLPRVVSALQSIGIDPYKELFLLVDEWHVLFNSYSFRHNAIKNLLAEAAKFDKATYMTATPIEREYMLEELRHLPTCEID